jgi:Na+-transporting NADH:ubiquinone oxidoreductase subunit C
VNKLVIPLLACIACAVVVSVTAVSVRYEQNLNKENEKKVKILAAAGIITDKVDQEFSKIKTLYVDFETNKLVSIEDSYDHLKASSNPELSSLVPKSEDIAIIKRRENIAPIYVWLNDDEAIDKIVLPIRGYGLWGTLYGYLSLDSDLNTVKGIEYYEHKETPGLGGEVDNPNWKSDWNGKRIYSNDGSVGLYVTKGPSSTDYEIDGISGATLTTNGVTNMIKYWLGDNGYGPVIKNLGEEIKNT